MAARVGTDRQENRADGPGGSKWKSWLRILGGFLRARDYSRCTHHQSRKAGLYSELEMLLGKDCGRDSNPG